MPKGLMLKRFKRIWTCPSSTVGNISSGTGTYSCTMKSERSAWAAMIASQSPCEVSMPSAPPRPQDPRPRDRALDHLGLVALDQVGEAGVGEQREQLLVVGHARAKRVD